MKLNRKTERKLMKLIGYRCVCNNCTTPVEYPDEFIVVVLEDKENVFYVVPIDAFECPYCFQIFSIMQVWKNLDVSQELEKIGNENL